MLLWQESLFDGHVYLKMHVDHVDASVKKYNVEKNTIIDHEKRKNIEPSHEVAHLYEAHFI